MTAHQVVPEISCFGTMSLSMKYIKLFQMFVQMLRIEALQYAQKGYFQSESSLSGYISCQESPQSCKLGHEWDVCFIMGRP